MNTQSVTLVELGVYERILPLASGYMQAFACQDPGLAHAYDFDIYTRTVHTAREEILRDLLAADSDIYGFSCYVWNMRLVRWLVGELLAARPEAQVMLGGPQVVHQPKYLDPEHEGLVLCNGEGERTFVGFLRELAGGRPDLTQVRGLSLYRDGELITTPPEDKIKNLDDLPSPFLTGVFAENRYTQAIFETNRGCPFRCSFCFWGLGDSRVSKFEEDRIFEEIDWLCHNGFYAIFFADANFGMLERDVRFAERLVENKRKTGLPYMVAFNSSKNKPQRLVEIAAIVQKADISATQSIAIQSLDENTLATIDRGNIKISAYSQAQQEMNQQKIASFVEMIWPLPGETLSSFKAGVDKMCTIGAQTFILYPLLLLQNTTMYERRDEHGFVTTDEIYGSAGEYEMVIATDEVDAATHDEGLRFIHAVKSLYNTRSLYCQLQHLYRNGRAGFSEVFSAFTEYCEGRRDFPYVARYEDAIANYGYTAWTYWGETFHLALHAMRDEFDAFLYEFASSQPWWSPEMEVLFELDLVNRPFVYSNTPIQHERYAFRHLDVQIVKRGYRVQVPEAHRALVRDYIEVLDADPDAVGAFWVDHRRNQLPFMRGESLEKNTTYCYGVMQRIKTVLPVWRDAAELQEPRARRPLRAVP